MLDLYGEYETDKDAEENGVWVDFPSGARVRIARWMCQRHRDELERLRRPYQDSLRAGGKIPAEKTEEINNKAASVALILDWEGVFISGKLTSYTPDLGEKVLKELEDFKEDVFQAAMLRQTFNKRALEIARENLAKP